MDSNRVVITGQQWLDQHYFDTFYAPKIKKAFADGKLFAVGAGDGVDKMAQTLLAQLCGSDDAAYARVTVFDKRANDGRLDKRFVLANGFESYPKRDTEMALQCGDKPIAVFAQYGAAATGGQLALLVQFLEANRASIVQELDATKSFVALANRIHQMQREHCEPWNEANLGAVKELYERVYNKEE